MIATLPKRAQQTAEWLCTKCGSTNRKLVPMNTAVADDRCVTCRARHAIWPGVRPVRWNSEAK